MRKCDGVCLEEALEERQNDEKDAGRSEANYVPVRCVGCEEM